jgi:hypothetical protein
MSSERLRILTMLENGTITAEEAHMLLEALEKDARSSKAARWFKVRVFERDSETPKVRVTLPLTVIKLALKLGGSCQLAMPDDARRQMEAKGIKIDEAMENLDEALAEVVDGKRFDLVNVTDDEDGTRVEVFIE